MRRAANRGCERFFLLPLLNHFDIQKTLLFFTLKSRKLFIYIQKTAINLQNQALSFFCYVFT